MTQQSENDRVRGYLLAQTERHDWPALWPRVVGPRLELLAETAAVSEEQADFKPAPDEWSIRDCLAHVLRASRGTLARIEGLAAGSASAAAAPETEADSLADLRTQLIADSSHYAGILERLPEQPNVELTAEHRIFGELNSRAWFLFQRLHDSDHLGQIRAIKEASGYPEA